jgi:Transcriptional regulator, AbiEi antitoxin, Type IV TA system/Transcriptional regulator, AbiEi antitoxin N-terminal domain
MSSMTRHYLNKLKSIIASLPRHVVLPQAWLEQKGISRKLAWWYCQSGWFGHLGHGAYYLRNDTPTLYGAIFSLNTYLEIPLHIGAKSALALLGRTHYVPVRAQTRLLLYVEPNTRVPRWFIHHHDWQEDIILIKRRLLENLHEPSLVSREVEGLSLSISSPERAMLETVFGIPTIQTYSEAILLMQGLTNLRAALVQELLELCLSIKAKRLFLHAAEKCGHPWLDELDMTKINLGSGTRTIVQAGVYDPKYQLIVPELKES